MLCGSAVLIVVNSCGGCSSVGYCSYCWAIAVAALLVLCGQFTVVPHWRLFLRTACGSVAHIGVQ
jgi:hypothetical protein